MGFYEPSVTVWVSGRRFLRDRAYLGLDIGGTGVKVGVFDQSGSPLAFSRRSFQPADGEIDIELIREAARECVREAVSSSGAKIRAMAVSSQGQTFVALDRYDQPLRPAIMWYDARAAAQSDVLVERLRDVTGAIPFVEPISSAPKIIWLHEKYPGISAAATCYLLLPDYFSYMLTGHAITDPETAASTGLYASGEENYNPIALAASGVQAEQLAQIKQTGEPVGHVLSDVAADWGLDTDTLLVNGTNDQYAGAIGAGNCCPGILTETTGTCLALVTLVENPPRSLPSGLFAGRFPMTRYNLVLAYAKTAGPVMDWIREVLCGGADIESMELEASRSTIGSGGVVVVPHFDGMVSPTSDADTRGLIRGLSLGTTRGDIYRAAMESLAFSLRENLEFLGQQGFECHSIRSIGGGAKSNLWLQIKANALGRPVERPIVSESATLGAALIAAVGAGEYRDIQEAVDSALKIERVFEPDSIAHALYEEPYLLYKQACLVS